MPCLPIMLVSLYPQAVIMANSGWEQDMSHRENMERYVREVYNREETLGFLTRDLNL